MRGHVARKGDVWYAVIYEGVDPVTGKERRRWHRAGTDRSEAEELATRLASAETARRNGGRSELSSPDSSPDIGCRQNASISRPSTFDGY